jgi:hypothetical protein
MEHQRKLLSAQHETRRNKMIAVTIVSLRILSRRNRRSFEPRACRVLQAIGIDADGQATDTSLAH